MSALISPSKGEKSRPFSLAVPYSAFDFHGLYHLCVKFEMVVTSLRSKPEASTPAAVGD